MNISSLIYSSPLRGEVAERSEAGGGDGGKALRAPPSPNPSPQGRGIVSCLLALILCLITGGAYAAGCNFSDPVNLSYKIPRERIEACLLNGADPPRDWRPKRGQREGVYKGVTGQIANVAQGKFDCPRTITKDLTCGGKKTLGFDVKGPDGEPIYPFCTGKPGGKSDFGAISVCDYGKGSPTIGVSGIAAAGDTPDNTNCLMNLFNNLSNGGNPLDAIDTSGGVSGTCANGSVAVCGYGTGSNVCLDEKDPETGKDTVKLHGPLDVTLTPGLINWIVFTDGGTLTLPDGSVMQIAPGTKVEYVPGGLKFNGGPVTPVPAGPGKVTAHFDGTARIYDDVVKGGSLRNNPDGTPN